MNRKLAISLALMFDLIVVSGSLAQEAKEGKTDEEKSLAKQAPTLKELQGHWVVDIDKIADTAYFRKSPKELPSAKNWMAKETLEFSESKVLFHSGKLYQDMTIKKEVITKYQGLPSLQIVTHLKQEDLERPSHVVTIFRRTDGGLEVLWPNDLVTRPLKRKSTK